MTINSITYYPFLKKIKKMSEELKKLPDKPIHSLKLNNHYCCGSNEHDKNIIWYVHRNTHEINVCEYCFKNGVVVPKQFKRMNPQPVPSSSEVCASALPINDKLYSMTYDNYYIRIQPTNIDSSIPFYIAPEHHGKVDSGLGIFMVSTQSKYKITIENLNAKGNPNGIEYFTCKCIIGGEVVQVNGKNSGEIYYSSKCEFKGMKTDSEKSFLFYSPSKYEKLGEKNKKKLNVNNIIKLELLRYKHITKKEKHTTLHSYFEDTSILKNTSIFKDYDPFNRLRAKRNNHSNGNHLKKSLNKFNFNDDGDSLSTGFGGNAKSSSTGFNFGGNGNSSTGFNFGGNGNSSTGFSFGGNRDDSDRELSYVSDDGDDDLEIQKKSLSFGGGNNNYSGGMTKSGGIYVEKVKTETTNDKFDVIDKSDMSLQIICPQDDYSKFMRNMYQQLDPLLKLHTKLTTYHDLVFESNIVIKHNKENINTCQKEIDLSLKDFKIDITSSSTQKIIKMTEIKSVLDTLFELNNLKNELKSNQFVKKENNNMYVKIYDEYNQMEKKYESEIKLIKKLKMEHIEQVYEDDKMLQEKQLLKFKK